VALAVKTLPEPMRPRGFYLWILIGVSTSVITASDHFLHDHACSARRLGWESHMGRAVFLVSIIAFAIFTVTASAAFAGLHGHWYSGEDYLHVNGRSRITGDPTKFCVKFSGQLECAAHDPGKPDYYVLECDRNRRTCDGALAVILPGGEPWLAKIEYQISSWTPERITANPVSPHRCVVTTLQIDLDSKEVIFTETHTKTIQNDATCIPENIGHTTTYKLEDY
jgi:hypothetical protein